MRQYNQEIRDIKRRLVLATAILVATILFIFGLANDNRQIAIITEAAEMPKSEISVVVQPAPEEELPQVVERYSGLALSEEDMDLLARIVYLEARGESAQGQQAVVEVILNRMVSKYFGDSLVSVIYQRDQFASAGLVHKAEPGTAQYEAIECALYGPNILPVDVVFFSVKPQNDKIWGSIGGHVFCYPWFYGDE